MFRSHFKIVAQFVCEFGFNMKQAFTWHNITKSFSKFYPPKKMESPLRYHPHVKKMDSTTRHAFYTDTFEAGVEAVIAKNFIPEDNMDELGLPESEQARNNSNAIHKQRSQILNGTASYLRREAAEGSKEDKEVKKAEKQQLVETWLKHKLACSEARKKLEETPNVNSEGEVEPGGSFCCFECKDDGFVDCNGMRESGAGKAEKELCQVRGWMHKTCAYKVHGNKKNQVEECLKAENRGGKKKFGFTCSTCKTRMLNPRSKKKNTSDSSSASDSSSSSSMNSSSSTSNLGSTGSMSISSNSSNSIGSSSLILGTSNRQYKVSENGPAGIASADGEIAQVVAFTSTKIVRQMSEMNCFALKFCPNCSHFMQPCDVGKCFLCSKRLLHHHTHAQYVNDDAVERIYRNIIYQLQNHTEYIAYKQSK